MRPDDAARIRRADGLARHGDPDRRTYWGGYSRGARRLAHGETFGTPEEHELLLARDDEYGRGYRDGLAGRDDRTIHGGQRSRRTLTPEQAREMQRRSVEARRRNRDRNARGEP